MKILAADVGGTNTRVALCEADTLEPQGIRRFRNTEFDSLEDVLAGYMAETDVVPDMACVAIAGPVRNGEGRLTNRDWHMDAAILCTVTGAKHGFVINDLEAQGHALDHVETRKILGPNDALPRHERRLVVGAGTGFNAAPVHMTGAGSGCFVVPSECGHISLPIWDENSHALSKEITDSNGFASVEEILAGRGLLRVYNYFCESDAQRVDSTTEIIRRMTSEAGPVEQRTLRTYTQFLGRVLGDLALIHLPWGGIFLIGGMAGAMEPFLEEGGFADAFRAKGRFADFLDAFQIHIVEDDYAALFGCAAYATRTNVG